MISERQFYSFRF